MHPWFQVEIGFRLQKYVFLFEYVTLFSFCELRKQSEKVSFFAISVSKFVTTSKIKQTFSDQNYYETGKYIKLDVLNPFQT